MDEEFGHIPFLNAIDLDILMHKDAHFGSNFSIMIDYYKEDGVGVMPDFELERLEELATLEKSLGTSLSKDLLPPQAVEQVERSRKMYQDLRKVYESGDQSLAAKISDLILTEKEFPEEEIENILKFGKDCFDALIHLVTSVDFYDPLFPGYGRTPIFAAIALEKLQDKRALPYLFSALGQENFFTDDAIIRAIISFKEEGKAFLLKRLVQEPISKENVHAIMALTTLEDDEDVAKLSLTLLEKESVRKNENFMRYLIFASSGLKHESDRMRFVELKKLIPSTGILREFDVVIKNWQ